MKTDGNVRSERRPIIRWSTDELFAKPSEKSAVLLEAANRCYQITHAGIASSSIYQLRADQQSVTVDFAGYLVDIASREETETRMPFCRIIQPQRTGKTVIAGHLQAATELHTLFLVPKLTLLDQTVIEFKKQIPGIPIGVYSGEEKSLVSNGVNIATYHSVQAAWLKGTLPEEIRKSLLIFADDGHRAMTAQRMKSLCEAFDPLAIRCALTATPDFSEKRALATFFPDLIHEITIKEALELDLLAPVRSFVVQTDANAENVAIVAGAFEEESLGLALSTQAAFEAARQIRYSKEHASTPGIIFCASRNQARLLMEYLKQHEPEKFEHIALVFGTTPREERRKIIEGFSIGKIDTIVNVGVFAEGWNSAICKLLIDLSPSISRVWASQKYYRPMTKHGDAIAHIYLVMPSRLRRKPVMPHEVFGESLTGYESGALIGSKSERQKFSQRAEIPIGVISIPGITVKLQFEPDTESERPKHHLRLGDLNGLRRVLFSAPGFSPKSKVSLRSLSYMEFKHPLFSGRGFELLTHLRVPQTAVAWDQLFMRLFPEEFATWYLRMHKFKKIGTPIERPSSFDLFPLIDNQEAIDKLEPKRRRRVQRSLNWLIADSQNETADSSPEDPLVYEELSKASRSVLATLTPREEKVLRLKFGIEESDGKNLTEISASFEVTVERIRQIEYKALKKLRLPSRSKHLRAHRYASIDKLDYLTLLVSLNVDDSFTQALKELQRDCAHIVVRNKMPLEMIHKYISLHLIKIKESGDWSREQQNILDFFSQHHQLFTQDAPIVFRLLKRGLITKFNAIFARRLKMIEQVNTIEMKYRAALQKARQRYEIIADIHVPWPKPLAANRLLNDACELAREQYLGNLDSIWAKLAEDIAVIAK